MADTPPKRIYLDTNILWNWPNCSNEIWNLFEFARWLKAEIYFPQIVEAELERQFLETADELTDEIDAKITKLRKHCRNIIDIDIPGQAPTYSDLQDAYRLQSLSLKLAFDIETVPLTTMNLEVFIEMAINREPPFEEISTKNKSGVVGLQDAAILFSVIQHIQKSPDPGRCIFLTNDGIFYHKATQEVLDHSEVTLERIHSADALWHELFDHIWSEVKASWYAETAQVETDLNAEKDLLTAQLEQIIDLSSLTHNLWIRAAIRKAFRIQKFDLVKLDLAPLEHRPPRAEYHRTEGSQVKISARATTEMDAMVVPSFWDSVAMTFSSTSQIPGLEDATLTEDLNVSILGIVHNGTIVSVISRPS